MSPDCHGCHNQSDWSRPTASSLEKLLSRFFAQNLHVSISVARGKELREVMATIDWVRALYLPRCTVHLSHRWPTCFILFLPLGLLAWLPVQTWIQLSISAGWMTPRKFFLFGNPQVSKLQNLSYIYSRYMWLVWIRFHKLPQYAAIRVPFKKTQFSHPSSVPSTLQYLFWKVDLFYLVVVSLCGFFASNLAQKESQPQGASTSSSPGFLHQHLPCKRWERSNWNRATVHRPYRH